MRSLGVLVLLGVLSSMPAFSGDEFQSVKDPDAQMLPENSKLLIECDDLAMRPEVEEEYLEILSKKTGIEPVAASTLFQATRTYSDADRERILAEAGIQFVLRVKVKSRVQRGRETLFTHPSIAAEFEVVLESAGAGPKLWVASSRYVSTSYDDIADFLADRSNDDLLEKGILPPKKRKKK